jgi:hypothetical protein
MRSAVLLIVCVSFATTLLSNGAEFSETRDLLPLKLAALDLDTILLKTHSVIAAVNGPFGRATFSSEECESLRSRQSHRDRPLLPYKQRCVSKGSFPLFLRVIPRDKPISYFLPRWRRKTYQPVKTTASLRHACMHANQRQKC